MNVKYSSDKSDDEGDKPKWELSYSCLSAEDAG